jgi:hypothetical protein
MLKQLFKPHAPEPTPQPGPGASTLFLRPEHLEGAVLLPHRDALVETLPYGVGAEIGVAFGDFSEKLLPRASKLYLIDAWVGERYEPGRKMVADRFAAEVAQGRVVIKRAKSVDALKRLPNHSLDWIYVDSDHSLPTTRAELKLALAKVKPDGVIAGDDFSVGNPKKGLPYGVIQAVHEFCLEHGWKFTHLTMEPGVSRSWALRAIAKRERV